MKASKANDDFPNYYRLLEVSPQASIEVIRAAYKAIAKKLHPDKGGSHSSIIELNAAYEVLCDPASRKNYDQAREKKEVRVVEKPIVVVYCLSCGKENRVADLTKARKGRCKGCGEAFQRTPKPAKQKPGTAAVFCFHCGTKNQLDLEEEQQSLAPFSSALMQASCSNCGFPFRDHVR